MEKLMTSSKPPPFVEKEIPPDENDLIEVYKKTIKPTNKKMLYFNPVCNEAA